MSCTEILEESLTVPCCFANPPASNWSTNAAEATSMTASLNMLAIVVVLVQMLMV